MAASDVHKYEDPPGLQDNLELAALWLSGRSRAAHWLLHVEWATTAHFLAAVLALVAGVAWEQVGGGSRWGIWIRLGWELSGLYLLLVAPT